MNNKEKKVYLALDLGERRIGVAAGDTIARLAQPLTTVLVSAGQERRQILDLISRHQADAIVAGLPRDQNGHETAQTEAARAKIHQLAIGLPVFWQDESLTSELAEDRLKQRKKSYSKEDIDAEAAAIILQDFLEDIGRHG